VRDLEQAESLPKRSRLCAERRQIGRQFYFFHPLFKLFACCVGFDATIAFCPNFSQPQEPMPIGPDQKSLSASVKKNPAKRGFFEIGEPPLSNKEVRT
jgi:hypothetical protein